MGQDNDLEPEQTDPKPASLQGGDDPTSPSEAEAAQAPGAGKALTPGQRLAAKKAQKAQEKRDFKEDLKRKDEEARDKELEEAQRLISPASAPALPDEVQQVAGTFSDFVQSNRGWIVGSVVGSVVIAFAVILVRGYFDGSAAEQTQLLSAAIDVAQAPIDPDDADGKTDDGEPVFKSREERTQKAAAAFATAVDSRPDSLAASWGRLAQASAELTSGHPDKAQALYQRVYEAGKSETVLATRALEGLALSAEAAGSTDQAKKHLEALTRVDQDLGEYHKARLKLAAGDREGAKVMLKTLYDRLNQQTTDAPPSRYLKGEVESRLAELDASLVDRGSAGGGQQFSQEELQRLIQQLQQRGSMPAENGAE